MSPYQLTFPIAGLPSDVALHKLPILRLGEHVSNWSLNQMYAFRFLALSEVTFLSHVSCFSIRSEVCGGRL